jgi:hypothetical protein
MAHFIFPRSLGVLPVQHTDGTVPDARVMLVCMPIHTMMVRTPVAGGIYVQPVRDDAARTHLRNPALL